ncbi:SDR family NAD(P)-dependent oxidoreductase [Streptomyces canus]|uniref:SDR family NAD(P)-dependent oxidoreductase n=1 Tax=Streptomyces canus TaxID=58343 RepID=UPI00369622D8
MGGTSGIGLATAERLTAAGAEVVVTGRDPEKLAAAKDRVAGAERIDGVSESGDACSSHVYQMMLTPAGVATTSRRSPGVRRRPKVGSPACAGVRRARRLRRNSASSRRRSCAVICPPRLPLRRVPLQWMRALSCMPSPAGTWHLRPLGHHRLQADRPSSPDQPSQLALSWLASASSGDPIAGNQPAPAPTLRDEGGGGQQGHGERHPGGPGQP